MRFHNITKPVFKNKQRTDIPSSRLVTHLVYSGGFRSDLVILRKIQSTVGIDVKITNYVIRRARPPIMFQHANEDRLGGVGQVVRLIGLSVVTWLHLWRIGAFSLPVSNLVAATATCPTLDFLDRHVAAHMVLSTTWPVVGISLVLALAVALRKSIASAELLFLFAFQRLRVGLLLLKDRAENLRRLALSSRMSFSVASSGSNKSLM